MRLHPGAGAIISWEPDRSPQVMTAVTSSLEPLWEPSDWDNGQPEHTCAWDCLCYLCPLPQALVYLNLQLTSVPPGWLKTSWVLTLPTARPFLYTKPLPSLCLFIWHLESGGWTWHMASQELGPWVQNSSFKAGEQMSLIRGPVESLKPPPGNPPWSTQKLYDP
jgi:hypothetical protein